MRARRNANSFSMMMAHDQIDDSRRPNMTTCTTGDACMKSSINETPPAAGASVFCATSAGFILLSAVHRSLRAESAIADKLHEVIASRRPAGIVLPRPASVHKHGMLPRNMTKPRPGTIGKPHVIPSHGAKRGQQPTSEHMGRRPVRCLPAREGHA